MKEFVVKIHTNIVSKSFHFIKIHQTCIDHDRICVAIYHGIAIFFYQILGVH